MVSAIKGGQDGDSLGGVVEVLVYGAPVGLAATCTGTGASTACCQAFMSIQAIK